MLLLLVSLLTLTQVSCAKHITRVVEQKKIGLCVMATGKYTQFVGPLIASAERHLCPRHLVYYFVFTDGSIEQGPRIMRLEQKRLGWPYDTLMRFAVYDKYRDILSQMDYLFSCDADMLFVGTIGDEILSDRVATLHPGFFDKPRSFFSYESNNTQSTAYIAPTEGKHYFAGGFYGGSAQEFLKIASVNKVNIEKDLEYNFIAVWHDESHLNRYFAITGQEPTRILTPAYCHPEKQVLEKKLLALDKDHAQMRQ